MTGIPGAPTAAIIVPFAAGFNSKLLLPEEMGFREAGSSGGYRRRAGEVGGKRPSVRRGHKSQAKVTKRTAG